MSNLDDARGLEDWLEHGGVLCTHQEQFRGMEADVVIVVSMHWFGNEDCRRSSVTRGVASLCLITTDSGITTTAHHTTITQTTHYSAQQEFNDITFHSEEKEYAMQIRAFSNKYNVYDFNKKSRFFQESWKICDRYNNPSHNYSKKAIDPAEQS